MENVKVGKTKRTFNFTKDKQFIIQEVLDNPEFSMNWTWNSGICPHCKKLIDKTINHKFTRIEILVDDSIREDQIIPENIVVMGDTLDKKRMIIPKEYYREIFTKSQNFKKYIEVL